MGKQLETQYNPNAVEDKIYKYWMDQNHFHAKVDYEKKPYTIMMPPPNITGVLHMGHALGITIQDTLTRFKRMQGYSALWLPGTDHASIATEAKIVEAMKKEGLKKEDIGREAFLKRAWDWKDKYGQIITEQEKKMGASCDWERERFTMDEGCNKAVKEAFVNLYDKGLIYRGEKLINWCPVCKTTISDAEVEHEEKHGSMWHIKYPLKDGSGHIEIATTRPETMLGDTAVAVNKDDERYKDFIGKTLLLPLTNREILIIADDYVDSEFGTGAVKMTPAHDPNDFEVSKRHDLEIINILDETGHINENGGKYEGLDRFVARKQIVKNLEELGLLVKIEDHLNNIGTCYRCHTIIEPRISTQWFVKMETLAKPANDAVREDIVKFVPKRFENLYFSWMDNIRDWNISRQLWWGHRIPAYYCEDCEEIIVSKTGVSICPKCSSTKIRQDEDVLDTWFSSALWPFSTLGWPEQTPELDYFYPTNTLVTGHDIIFFWVARMIFSGLEHTSKKPFDHVLIHSMVLDEHGKGMSKSLGNGVDPLEMIDKYGADALRLNLMIGNSAGNNIRFSEKRILSSRNFANKLWNAARFVLMNIPDDFKLFIPTDLRIEDMWVLTKTNELIEEVTENLEKFEISIAAQKLYDFTWDVYCDWFIELAKPRLQESPEAADNARQILVYVMDIILKLLHPIMPFITHEIFEAIPNDNSDIIISKWPVKEKEMIFKEETEEFQRVIDAIRGIRNQRAEMNVPPSKKAKVIIETKHKETFESTKMFFIELCSASEVLVVDKADVKDGVQIITDSATIFIPMEDLLDKKKEMERLEKEKEKAQKDIDFLASKLSNKGFVDKAPKEVVEKEQEKLKITKELLARIEEGIENLKK